ncbi:MAG: bifunctional hydroxymethylpyrimidine kinase/phosphomethylpyrimidine kinase [Bacteroidota bacterium]
MPNPNEPGSPRFHPVVVGALYPSVERGLAADLAAARALGGCGYPVCTSLVMAGHNVVTDATDVPEDTIRAQLEHVMQTVQPAGVKIGVLSSHPAAEAVFRFADSFDGPVVLDIQLSGPSGETVLTRRGIGVLMDHLAVSDLVVVGHADAELLSEGEINSLDDAQVAAQRLAHRGARAVVIKCGTLPARHFEANGDAPDDTVFNTDLYFDGEEFALFEAPHARGVNQDGTSSLFSLAALQGLAGRQVQQEALQYAKRLVTDSLHKIKK